MKRNRFYDQLLLISDLLCHKLYSVAFIFFVSITMGYGDVDWTAYNDCIGSTSANPNTTEFTAYSDYVGVTAGLLKNDATGGTAGMPTVTFTIPVGTEMQPRSEVNYGSTPAVNTEAYNLFNGKVDFSGTIIQHSTSVGWFVEIKFSNLDPAKRYTFAGSAFRNTNYPDRITQHSIAGADTYTNNSSEGVYEKNGAITKFLAGDNSSNGYVVRWDDIDPGADGEFSIYTASASSNARYGYPLHGFMLQQIDISVNTPPIVDAGADQNITLPKEYLTLTGSSSDDGQGNPDGYLQTTWSQLSGPAGVEFVTDAHQSQVTARFPVAGEYELQLYATDGLLDASDAVRITVGDSICPVGDMDGDCIVRLSDLSLLAGAWMDDMGLSYLDLNGDTLINIEELTLLAQSWLEDWTGSLQVTLLPTEVAAAGARWRVDGGAWQSSGAVVSSLPEGSHEIEYSVVAGWSGPGIQPVQVTRQEATVTSGQYSQAPREIVISEFMATNSYLPFVNSMNIYTRYDWKPNENVYPDWIELHNIGSEAINLAGWYLTDDPDNLTQWQFPSDRGTELVLNPDQYLIVFASGKEQALFPANYPYKDYYGALHTNFDLSASGEYLAVVAPDGLTVSYAYNEYPAQFPFIAYGIAMDNTPGYLTPTPGSRVNNQWTGAANSAGLPDKVADTKFSHSRGFYQNAFDVTISCSTVGAEIHYTLDGTEPKSTVGGYTLLYSGPIPISTTTCLRAKAFKTGLLPSNIDTQTYLFLDKVVEQVKPADSRYVTSWQGFPADYEMENNQSDIKLVAGSAAYTVEQSRTVIKNALEEIPTLSVVTDPDNLFGGTNGIYTHTESSGDLWERPVSAEYFSTDPNDTFQVDCGLVLQGGASRNPASSPKHSLSLRFRGGYGDSTLKTAIFKQTAVQEFDSLQLRAVYNNSWVHWDPSQRVRATLIRDQFIRDSLIAMGQKSGCDGTFVHLYLNGLYWGIYNLHERPEASHYAAYYGGDSDYYDALNGGAVTDGVSTSWNNLQTTVQSANSSSLADWAKINTVLDVENYIDWTIIQHYGLNQDLKADGNWRVAGGGLFSAPWRFFAWDVERTMENGNVGNTSPYSDFNAPFLLGYLRNFAEFRIQFADRLYMHFRNQGALTYTSASARFNKRVNELGDAIIAESARWGDYRRDVHVRDTAYLFTKNNYWLPSVSAIDGYLSAKETSAITYFKGLSPALYPAIEPPAFRINYVSQYGGDITAPSNLSMSLPSDEVWYTLDGSDPRQAGGAVNSSAVRYLGQNITLNKTVQARARSRTSGGVWSALADVVFAAGPVRDNLRITEVMYHPTDPNLEYVELKNIGAASLNLNLVRFSQGLTHSFGDVSVDAGGLVLLVKDKTVFESHYTEIPAGVPIIQWQEGSLNNAGEAIELQDALGRTILSFVYKDSWYPLTDGDGFSLTIIDPANADVTLWGQKAGWRPSVLAGGSPGTDEVGLAPDSIVINEILAHSDNENPDWIEFYNTTNQDISLGGWYLTDDAANLTKYIIPDNTQIRAFDYLVLYENTDFGSAFALSENGENVILSATSDGQITGFQVSQDFDASERNVSFGRYIKSTGGMDFVAMESRTPNEQNSNPKVGPVVITEIQYNPSADNTGDEYIELRNISSSAVMLQDAVKTEIAAGVYQTDVVPWQFTEGIDFTFPMDTTIPAGGVIIVAKNPTAFGAYYAGQLPAGTVVFGPFANDTSLSNGGEKVRLCRAGDQPLGQPRNYIRVDQVNYDDLSPWPVSPDGQGQSLTGINPAAYGNDVANWAAAAPSPGQ